MSNTEQKQKILLKRTTEVDRPSIPSGASHGELFLNIASGANAHNKISTMQIGTNNPIIWSDDVANEKKFASKTEVEALVKEVEDNELVTATAISTMNASAGFNEDGSSVLEGGMSLSEAIIDLRENGTKGNSYVWLFPEFPYGDNIAITDEELENFKKYNMVAFKSIIPTDETSTKVSEQYHDGVKTYSDDETIKFVSFWAPQRLGDEPNPYKWQLVTFNVNISITDKTISYYPEGYDVGELADSATTSISATTAVSAKTSVSASTSVSAKTSVNAVSASTSVSAKTSVSATTSTKAIQDGDGNVITTTYSTKEELSGAVNDIIEEIIDNELVTSTAISTMNASAGFNEDGSSVLEGGVSLSEAIIELQNKTQDQGNYYFYLNESGELASDTISDEEIEKLRNSKNIYVVDNNNGFVFNCDYTVSVFGVIGVFGSMTIWNTNNTVTTTTVQIIISPTENRVALVSNEFYVASSYLLRVTCDDTTGVIGGTLTGSSEIEEIRKSNIVFVKIELPEGEYTFSCSKKDDNDSIITLVGSQVYGLDGYWTNTSKIVSLIITIDTSTIRYSGQIYNIVTGEHSKLADSATTSISATTAVSASTSDKAYKDGSGNVISSTYATKSSVVQSDWNTTATTDASFIKNKPTISGSTILGVTGNTVMIQNVKSTSPSTITIGDDTVLKSKSNNSNAPLTRSIASGMCIDTTVPDTYLKLANGTKWGSGYNNAILTISRYNTDKYSSQLGFSQSGIYYRGFGGTLPTTSASWAKVLLSNDTISADTALVYSNDSQQNKLYLVGATTAGVSDYKQLYNDSRIYTSGGCLFATSDERLKDFYEDVDCDLEALKSIPKKYFSWKSDDGKGRQVGTSAQELRKLYPEIVSVDEDGTHSVAYDRLSIVALSAIDKLYDTIKELQAKNEELEKRIKELENK